MAKEKDDFHYIQLGLIIVLILIALYVGHRVGYAQGYTYVKEYKDDYMQRWCSCVDAPEPLGYPLYIEDSTPDFLTKYK